MGDGDFAGIHFWKQIQDFVLCGFRNGDDVIGRINRIFGQMTNDVPMFPAEVLGVEKNQYIVNRGDSFYFSAQGKNAAVVQGVVQINVLGSICVKC